MAAFLRAGAAALKGDGSAVMNSLVLKVKSAALNEGTNPPAARSRLVSVAHSIGNSRTMANGTMIGAEIVRHSVSAGLNSSSFLIAFFQQSVRGYRQNSGIIAEQTQRAVAVTKPVTGNIRSSRH